MILFGQKKQRKYCFITFYIHSFFWPHTLISFVCFHRFSGALKGTPYLTLKNDHAGQKGKSLTLSNHTKKDNHQGRHHSHIYKDDDRFGLYNLMWLYDKHLLPPDQVLQDGDDTLFRYQANKQQIKKWKVKYGKRCTWLASPLKSRVIGANQFNALAVRLAKMCDYDNPTTNRGHGNRKSGILLLCNNGVGVSTIKNIAGHANIETTSHYHKSNAEDLIRASMALQGTNIATIRAAQQSTNAPAPPSLKRHRSRSYSPERAPRT